MPVMTTGIEEALMRANNAAIRSYTFTPRTVLALTLIALLSAGCGGGGGGDSSVAPPPPPPATYTVGGMLSGLVGSGLALELNGGGSMSIAAKATSFAFSSALQSGASYSVSIASQPTNPTQICAVSDGSGTVGSSNVTSIAIACKNATFQIGGSVSGLTSSGLVLQINGAGNLPVAKGATAFTFPTPLASGASYSVSVATQPSSPAQKCTVSNGSGTVGSSNVTGVAVACTNVTYQIGGTIKGLTGSGLMLKDNGGDTLPVAANAQSFTFATPLGTGAMYSVTVSAQPTSPNQICTVANGSGTVGSANISSVTVSCANVGRFAYVANYSDGANGQGDVSAFTINPTSGALTAVPGGAVAADSFPSAIVADRSGQFLYVSNAGTADVTIFGIDQSTGALSVLNKAVFTPSLSGRSIAVAPSNQYLFVGGIAPANTGGVTGFVLNDGSGSLTVTASKPTMAGNAPYGVAVDPSSQFLFATTAFSNKIWVYSIGTGGVLTALANTPFSAGAGTYGVVASPLGTSAGGFVYTADSTIGTISAFSYDGTGNLTQLGGPYGAGSTPEGIAIDPTGSYLYVANYGDGTISAFTIDGTGALTPLGAPVATGNLTNVPNPGPIDVKLDPSGQFMYVVNNLDGSVSLFTLQNGVPTLAGTVASGAGAVAVAVE